MEWMWNYVLWSILITLMPLAWHLRRKNSYRRAKLPPGPQGWPVIGNIFDLGASPHRSLAALKQKYGPVVWLNLGAVKTMVILSAGAAEELFKNHDLSFIDRFNNDVMRADDYYKSSMALGLYSPYWRTLRRICTVELFSNKRINEAVLVRQRCVNKMLSWIEKELVESATGEIEVKDFLFPAIFNMIGNLTLSQDLMHPNSEMASEFYMALSGFSVCLTSPNISDLFPWLRWLDLQGLRRRTDRELKKAMQIISGFVRERVKQRQHREGRATEHKDFLDVVLDYEGNGKDEPVKLSDHQITIFLMHLADKSTIFARPSRMDFIYTIINFVIIVVLVLVVIFLSLMLKLYAGKDIRNPKNTHVFVNAWAIGRDEEIWEDALSFKPERFLESSIGYKGQDYEFIPFGVGRRFCPGLPLADRVLPLNLGSLLHYFDWKPGENSSGEMTI
uniref:Cytochrome P450 n=1 Tax=Daucus carota subsp. sativus TaxID=79200 RepID=A0A175YQ26_DAUCS